MAKKTFKSAFSSQPAPSYLNQKYGNDFFSQSAFQPMANPANQQLSNPSALAQLSQNSHVTPMQDWSGGFSQNYMDSLPTQAPMQNQGGGMWDQLKGWANRPQNMTADQYGGLDTDQLIKAGGLKTNLQGTLDNLSTGVDILGAGFGMYSQLQNNKYQKKMSKMYENEYNQKLGNQRLFARNAGAQTV